MKTQKFLTIPAGLLALTLLAGCGKSKPLDARVTEADLTNLVSTAAVQADPRMTRFDARPGSKVRIEGTSTVHDWQVEGIVVGGFMEVGFNFPAEPGQSIAPGKVLARAEVVIPARSLRSIEKDGSPYSDKMDEIMYGKLKQPEHPKILYRLNELVLKEAPKETNAPYVLDAKGELVVAGATNRIAMPVKVLPLGDKKLKITGSLSAKMTDFGIQPPVLVGILSTGDEVKLLFDWLVEQKPTPTATAAK